MDQTQLNKFKNPKDKVTQEKLLEANVLDKWAKPAMTRRVLWKTTNGEHRTMIKKDYGIKREVVEELTAFPLGTYCIHNAFTSLLLRWLWVTDQRLTSLQSLTSQRNQEGQKKQLISQDTNVLSFKLTLCYVKL